MAHARRFKTKHKSVNDDTPDPSGEKSGSLDSVLSPKKEWVFAPLTVYEFTLNLNDPHQCKNNTSHKGLSLRYTEAVGYLENVLKLNTWKYFLVPEISMPQYGDYFHNKLPRIHWHGFMIFPTESAVLEHLLVTGIRLAAIGRYQFNPARPEYWTKYCLKHQNIFKSLGYVSNVDYIDDIANWSLTNDKLGLLHKEPLDIFKDYR